MSNPWVWVSMGFMGTKTHVLQLTGIVLKYVTN